MGFSFGSIANSIANISSRKSDKGKKPESSLYEFLGTLNNYGVQIKANYEIEFLQVPGLQFFCQSINIPGLQSINSILYHRGRQFQIPVVAEQAHEVQMTVINDASGKIYPLMRQIMIEDYNALYPDNQFSLRIKARSDQQNTAGMNIVLEGVRITNVSGLDYSNGDGTVQTFNMDLYVNHTDFEIGEIQKKEGLLGKVDKISNKISNILGK